MLIQENKYFHNKLLEFRSKASIPLPTVELDIETRKAFLLPLLLHVRLRGICLRVFNTFLVHLNNHFVPWLDLTLIEE